MTETPLTTTTTKYTLFLRALLLICSVTKCCPNLCDPMSDSQQVFSVHGIFQVWILEWVAISFSRGPSRHRDRTRVSHIVGRCFMVQATREARRHQQRICSPSHSLPRLQDTMRSCEHTGRWRHLQPKRIFTRHQTDWYFDLGLLSLCNFEKIDLHHLSLPDYGVCYGSLRWLRH